MFARAAVNMELDWNPPPCPKSSWLDDWFLGSERDLQPCTDSMPLLLEVHEELTKSWRAPFTVRSCFTNSSILTTLNGGAARMYMDVPQVERAVAVHLCPQNVGTWQNRPRLPSRALSLMAKAYSTDGQVTSALHAMRHAHSAGPSGQSSKNAAEG